METKYCYDAAHAEEKLRKMKEMQLRRSNEKIAAEQAYLSGYQDAINEAIHNLISWEFEKKTE